MNITFQPLTPEHLPLMHGWLQLPHVREFWDDGDRTSQQVEAHYFAPQRNVLAFIAALDSLAFAYAQAYPVAEDSDCVAWRSDSGETWGIDLFIGESHWLGRGLAAPLITAFMAHLQELRPELRRVLIDPEMENGRARHVYRKAGFSAVGTAQSGSKELEIMALDLPTQPSY
ncbi:MAG: GNAT family N-acetyltransferase [Deinococcus sp.]|uniref:GNAT family N-acetyltransferase n=1 Tax=Deinococcus sp. TaxID=47478 RepID=UPI0026DD8FA3|nr:GNAT family N-acetyltransferase [Deinococcus sp.]MDO4244939.1 GNAT family N-acetyltransferase [Deinococcus sp.]